MKNLVIILLSLATSSYANIKIDIRNHSAKWNTSSGYAHGMQPSVTIDCRTPLKSYKQAPLILMAILTESRESGKIELFRFYFKLDAGWCQYYEENVPPNMRVDIKKMSKQMPLCDYKKLSPATLRNKEGMRGNSRINNEKKKTILAYKTSIMLNGIIVKEKETIASSIIKKGWDLQQAMYRE